MPKPLFSARLASRHALPALLGLASLQACDCQGGPRVPFKLNEHDASTEAGASEANKEPLSATFAPGEPPQELEGATLPWTAVRAVLSTDLDQDGDRDVIAIHEADGKVRVVAALRNDNVFEAPREVFQAREHEAGACSVEYAELTALSASKALALFSRVCGPEKRAEPRSYAVLSLEPTPRVLSLVSEQVTPAEPEAFFTLEAESLDADSDTHDDVALKLFARGYGSSEDALRLTWFDRPSGLVRDPKEPEATLKTWADKARGLVAQSPEQALERAELVLRVRKALCVEESEPSVYFADRPGIVCGAGKSVTEALITSVLAHARLGHVARAFDANKQLKKHAGASLDAKTTAKLDEALSSLPASPGIVLRRGGRVEPQSTPKLRLPAARFLGETSLLVTRAEPVLFDLASGEESALQVPQDALVRDPSGQFAVTAIEHSCSGYYLRIERAPGLGEPYLSVPGATAALWPEIPSPECGLKKSQKREVPEGVFSVLGWAPQGVVVALGSETRIVPLDLAGKPAGAPRSLPARTPLPAPLPSGPAAPDGGRYVEATPYGVLLYNVREGDAELWRPEGYLALGKAAREAAVSPSGRRVAVVIGDTFYTLERAP